MPRVLVTPRRRVYFAESTVNTETVTRLGRNLPFRGHAYILHRILSEKWKRIIHF